MATAFALGALNQIQNIGQIGEIVQGQVHQKEQISWTRRGYLLDSQSLRLDALDHAKEEIKSHYDTYVSRIDTLLLVLALIWPFALNLIQYSDPFVPGIVTCPDGPCVEEAHPWLIWIWVLLMALILILPFWGILMLIRCKLQLDNWLEYSLAGLNQKRRLIMEAAAPLSSGGMATSAASASKGGKNETASAANLSSLFTLENSADKEQETHEETEKIVHQLVTTVLRYQEYLAGLWTAECGWLVRSSTAMLWMSVVAALLLTSMSIWIFLANKGGEHAASGRFFLPVILSGCLAPGVYVLLQYNSRKKVVPPPAFDDDDGLIQEPFPLSTAHLRAASFKHLPSLQRQPGNGQKLNPLAEMDPLQQPMRRSRSETDVASQRRMSRGAAPLAASSTAQRASAEKLPWWRCHHRRSTCDELHKPLVQDRG